MLLRNTFMILVPGQNISGFQQLKAEHFTNKILPGLLIFQWERKTRKKYFIKEENRNQSQKEIYLYIYV